MTEQANTPNRARKSRVEAEAGHRRRRRGILDVMKQTRLDFFEPGMLDLENYVYRWVNDENGRLRALTRMDDYDFVSAADLGEHYDQTATDSESEDRVRMIVGQSAGGGALYAYLCRKPREFWEADNAEMVAFREATMKGRVYGGELTEEEVERAGADAFYVPKDNHLTDTRRRGRVTA